MMSSKQASNTIGGGNSPTNYTIIDAGADQISIIKIESGKFRGVQFRFGGVGFTDSSLKFTTEIIKKPWRLMFINLKTDDLFTDVTGNILLDLMSKNANECQKFLVG